MKNFPFISLSTSVIVLRCIVALMFIAHAVVRITGGTVTRFGEFLESKGFVAGVVIVLVLTAFEIIGGLLMAFGYYTRWMAAGFILILLTGIVLIHAELGWFVGEHGTGGVEYSVVLIAALVVVAASAKK
jgi:putative oxidoreductase